MFVGWIVSGVEVGLNRPGNYLFEPKRTVASAIGVADWGITTAAGNAGQYSIHFIRIQISFNVAFCGFRSTKYASSTDGETLEAMLGDDGNPLLPLGFPLGNLGCLQFW